MTPGVMRVGTIGSISNTTMETELPEMLGRRAQQTGERLTFHSSRAQLLHVDPEPLDPMVGKADRCVRELIDAPIEALVYACLVAIVAHGRGAHVEAEARLVDVAAEKGVSVPELSRAGALIVGVEALGRRRIVLITPYADALTELVVDYIEDCGISVTDARSLRVTENVAVARLDPMNLVVIAQDPDTTSAEGIVLSACVQIPSLAAIRPAQQTLGRPVLSAANATVYALLRALNRDPVVPEAGGLLAGSAVACQAA